jgi:hypothetical protein
MAIPSFSSTVVARAAAALYGLQLGYATMNSVMAEANVPGSGGVNALIDGVYARDFGNATTTSVAQRVVANLGITGAGAPDAVAYVQDLLDNTPAANRGSAVAEAVALFSTLDTHPVYGAAASAFNGRIASAVAYGQTAGTFDRAFNAGVSLGMTLGQDFLTGTPGNDVITARVFNNSNTWQSGDWTDGGAGNDRIEADQGDSADFAVTPETVNVETIAVRGQARPFDSGDNNVIDPDVVKIDAERIVGAQRFESNNSRADVMFEDVRILPSQITKDITIAFVESDPGHVDYSVYFDQYSLRNQVSNTSSINLQIMDTVAAAAGEAPLKESNYGAFTFTVTIGGVSRVVTLGSQAIQDAQTYAEMAAAFQAALDAEFGPGVASATVGDNFTVVDPASRIAVTGQNIVLTTNTAATFSTPAGSGWLASGTAPAASNFYTNYFTGTTASASLVTSTVILDDVGRGSTGGDLVIGGLSVGSTSSSLGVQRFEIEVQDNSKLESMNSTNNTLREVTIKNGLTSNSGYAYVTTTKDAGNLTVNGASGANGANVSGFSNRVPVSAIVDAIGAPGQNVMPGVQSTTLSQEDIQTFGFTDVRLIDATEMRGKFEFTAQVTSSSLAKYLNTKDIQSNPAADNIAFTYNGGTNDDTMWVRLDSNAVASRSTIMVGREDFTFAMNGGAGNDWITAFVDVTTMPGGFQHWYTNQKLNKNITLDGGAGNDTIRKPGAGDVIINGGSGDDTVYADNSGDQTGTAGTANSAGAVFTAAESAELARAIALAAESNSTNDTADVGFLPLAQPLNTVAALDAINLLTPATFNEPGEATPNPLLPTKADLRAAIDAAAVAGEITVQQQLALHEAYNLSEDGEISEPDTLVRPELINENNIDTDLTSGEFTAGNNLLATYITAAEAALAAATAADEALADQLALLTGTQATVVTATIDLNGVPSPEAGSVLGSAVELAGLEDLRDALEEGATDVEVVEALFTALDNQIIDAGEQAALFAAATGGGVAGEMDDGEEFDVRVILDPMIAAATVARNADAAALAAAIAADDAAVRAGASDAGEDPDAAADVATTTREDAEDALETHQDDVLAPQTDLQAELAALKAALSIGTSDLEMLSITAGVSTELNDLFTAVHGDTAANILNPESFAAPAVDGEIEALEKEQIDILITAAQQVQDVVVDALQDEEEILQATLTAAEFAEAEAIAAAAGPNTDAGTANNKAVWVLNTANQLAVTTAIGSGYVLAVNDERNVNDLKSDANNVYNFYAATVTVTFKHLTATVNVPNTGFRTSDLQINQAIKDAVNNNAVLNKLISAADGPANTLVITSLIDGVMSTDNFGVELTLPALAGIVDVAGASAVYGTAATAEAVLAAMQAALTTFNTEGDYVDQLAETGANGGNVRITGAASTTTSDNTITPGDGNDVTVLGTTSDVEALLSSNDRVVFAPAFGNDTVVHFRAGSSATGGDVLVLSALGGNVLTTAFNVDDSINVATETTTNDTAAEVAALFADSTTAQTHVYIAVDAVTNVGKVYSVTDAAGTGAGNVTATLQGTIDLADTLWSTLTAENFA